MPISINFNRFKEPRGFIKIIEFFIAILAFSITAGYNSESNINVSRNCTGKIVIQHIKRKFSYSFDEADVYAGSYKCNGSTVASSTSTTSLPSSLNSSSEFFVFVGVISFLYCIVAVVFYVFFEDATKYGPGGTGRQVISFATLDFIVTAVLALFWFCASVAWAVGIPKLKDKTDPDDACSKFGSACKVIGDDPKYYALTISVLFGFLSCFLWGANLWFVFKETVWHKEPGSAAASAQKTDAEVPHQEVPGESMA